LARACCAWAIAGRPLVANPDLKRRSIHWASTAVLTARSSPWPCRDPSTPTFHGALGAGGHQHTDADECATCDKAEESAAAGNHSFQNLLTSLEKASEIRTNPKSASEAHKRYLRRQVENKLRFAYQLDPAHYANYNSLHFFLTEPALGTRPELTPSAAKLAEDTINTASSRTTIRARHSPPPPPAPTSSS
jgi:hypothetical protein